MLGMSLFIVGIVFGVAIFGFALYLVIRFVKEKPLGTSEIVISKELFIQLIASIGSVGLMTILSSYGGVLWGAWNLSAIEHLCIIFGSYFFGSGFSMLVASFILYYYKPKLNEKQRNLVRIMMFASIGVTLVFFFIMTEGFAYHISYPLYNAIDFGKGLTSFKDDSSGFRIAFYGVIVVGGAVGVYFICDHYFYKKYGKHGIIDTLFLVAFPMGLVGARLWYCLVLRGDYYLANPALILHVWDGGLAIQGGALLGIIAGVSFMLLFRKYVDIRWAIDTIVPTILIAQAIGRWGNFFNCEVFGEPSLISNWWFLPSVIKNQMQYTSVTVVNKIGEGEMYVPLFLIESVINLCGYFLIRYATKPINKYLPLLSRGGMYILWYGLVRLIMEPMRNGYGSGVGDGFSQSKITAIVMIGLGALVIGASYLWGILEARQKNLDHFKTYDFE